MLMVISPAKTLDYETPWQYSATTEPDFLADSKALIEQLRKLSPQDISSLMSISDKLGTLNFDRFQQWQTPFTQTNARPALLAFKGDVYTGLGAENFAKADFQFAQKHLRILSGLYGLLRPMDLMQAYRLEMGTKFSNDRAKDLYGFWGQKITDALNTQLKKLRSDSLVNLASNEYFKAVKPKSLAVPVITPVFKDCKNGQYKIISFYAKKARGLMAAYAIKERITAAEKLKAFDCDGYYYVAEQSSATEWVFLRDEQA
ncbi:peroxide stress protein YaaA [Simiduia sp. 21SJ11W-1]|uniref:peroxide stress protein YaaA n=1 Tax=Simiduia sp. 21SJ11W-1 TaxID=2909669 RepID=UPI00209DA3F7|nr:peroxide stress protein YaaA [Simiduia sp. 21SJ11W-1]UTA47973.1 peroxide stress protein YaaA [Simiduia sp. 21SJ11W-1]